MCGVEYIILEFAGGALWECVAVVFAWIPFAVFALSVPGSPPMPRKGQEAALDAVWKLHSCIRGHSTYGVHHTDARSAAVQWIRGEPWSTRDWDTSPTFPDVVQYMCVYSICIKPSLFVRNSVTRLCWRARFYQSMS